MHYDFKSPFAEEKLLSIIAEVEEGDVDGVYNLFAPGIWEKEENLKNEMSGFIELYQGEYVSSESTHYEQWREAD